MQVPLYVNSVKVSNILAKVLAEDKGIVVRRCLKEVRVQVNEDSEAVSRRDNRDRRIVLVPRVGTNPFFVMPLLVFSQVTFSIEQLE